MHHRRVQLPVLLFVLLLAPMGVPGARAEDETPTPPADQAVRAATRNLLRTLAVVKGADRVDALARYVDVERVAKGMFGDAAKQGTTEEHARLKALLTQLLVSVLFEKMPHPQEAHTVKSLELSSEKGEAGRLSVGYSIADGFRKENVGLVWIVGGRVPRLVDVRHPSDGLMTASVRHAWERNRVSPRAFLKEMIDRHDSKKNVRAASGVVKSKDNIRTLITLMIGRRTQRVTGSYAHFSGKAFVLSLVAQGELDRRNPTNLEILFSPGDEHRSLKTAGIETYANVTKASLTKGLDVGGLTSYAGHRNGEAAYLITPDQEKVGTPLIADLSFPDMAIIGFSNGSVRTLTRKELGLGPKDPIVAGEESKSELLRYLSSK